MEEVGKVKRDTKLSTAEIKLSGPKGGLKLWWVALSGSPTPPPQQEKGRK